MAAVTVPPGLCRNCGHPESDHETEEDYSYCLGNLGGTPCKCHGYEDPGDEWED